MTEQLQGNAHPAIPIRRFAVQPVETSTKSHRAPAPKISQEAGGASNSRRRFVPQLEETSERSHRKGDKGDSHPKDESLQGASTPQAAGGSTRRRFAPQLVETAKRSRKSGDAMLAMKHTDKTDLSPGDKVHVPRHIRLAESLSPELRSETNLMVRRLKQDPELPESRFSYASLSRKNSRQTSFRVPQLEPIASPEDSEESGKDSNLPSLSTTPSAVSDGTGAQKHARRQQQSGDERFSGYLLALAARAAEKQLREQALAAFPNERFNEPVNHFAFRRDGEDSDDDDFAMLSGSFDVADAMQRRMSATGWDLAEMQKHKEKLEEQRKKQNLSDVAPLKNVKEIKDPWKNPFDLKTVQNNARQDQEPDQFGNSVRDPGELSKMRSAASPPMLGKDLSFVHVLSPKQTMIDATQKPRSRTKKSGEPASRQHSGLWTPCGGASPTLTRKNSTSPSSPALWGGFCKGPDKAHLSVPQTHHQTGVMTPHAEHENMFGGVTPASSPCHALPSSPGPDSAEPGSDLGNIDAVLTLEATLDEEYPDDFVTQLYNYLSLGYPALAWKFDHELSKISRMPLEEIRKGDGNGSSRGYVGAPDGEGWDESDVRENCGRWFALRLYVREWARQQPRMAEGGKMEWGQRARRGSWAI